MKQILQKLFNSETLSREEAKAILIRVANAEFNDAQVAAFLTVFNVRNITIDEFTGFREAMLELCVPVDLGNVRTMDLCGTGGDGKDTFNISTISSFVVAASGVKVAKHGNKSVSSKCGSSNVLEYLGVPFYSSAKELSDQLSTSGICFLHAPLFHPAMKNVAPVRTALGTKTFFNMLGPLVNPARPQGQMTGVFNTEVARLYYYVLQEVGIDFSVVYDLNGYDEISLTGPVKIYDSNGESLLEPSDFGLPTYQPNDILGGNDVASSAAIFLEILGGKGTAAQNDVVAANAGLAIATYNNIALKDAVMEASEMLKSGKAMAVLNSIIGKNE
ncbi:MAG: anthranilate phosphoribosyltransferase [Bacteroidetes bacterium]|nr:anthranilate phosphoribosyltransferase [Bacteroidota bacterium]